MENFCRELSIIILGKNNNNKEIDHVRFGLEIIITQLILFLSILLFGLYSNQLYETFIYLISFITLRRLTNGYHAKTYTKCYCLTIASYLTILLLARNISTYFLIPTLIPVYIIFFRQPNLKSETTLDYCKRTFKSKIALLLCTLLATFFVFRKLEVYTNILLLSMFLVALLCDSKTEEEL